MEPANYNNQRGGHRGHNSNPRQFQNSEYHPKRGGGQGRGDRGGRGGRGGFRGSRNDRKDNRKGHYRHQVSQNANYQTMDMSNNLPYSIDLTNQALVEHVGEIFYKDSFLMDPWQERPRVQKIQDNQGNQGNTEEQNGEDEEGALENDQENFDAEDNQS